MQSLMEICKKCDRYRVDMCIYSNSPLSCRFLFITKLLAGDGSAYLWQAISQGSVERSYTNSFKIGLVVAHKIYDIII